MPSPTTATRFPETTDPVLTAKAVEPMYPSKTNPSSTKAGIALSADARHKLQQLADWVENGKPGAEVTLMYAGGVLNNNGRTYVSPIGALVQMFHPVKLAEAKQLSFGLYRAPLETVNQRAADILGIPLGDLVRLRDYLYSSGFYFCEVVKVLRSLK